MIPPPDLLRVHDLRMCFGGLVAIDRLTFTVRRNEITALIGPNGAGKTTAFNCITGFYRPSGGTITLHGDGGRVRALHRLPGHRIARAGIARTFQNIRLFPGMTVLENLLVAQHAKLMPTLAAGLLDLAGLGGIGRRHARAIEQARHRLDQVGLVDRANHLAGTLPYGAQRRLEIARALCTDPLLLCLDEPAAGLNPRESAELNGLLLSLRQAGCTVLLIEHDMRVVMRVSDRVLVLDGGRLIADGTPDAVRAAPRVVAAYLGEDNETGDAAA